MRSCIDAYNAHDTATVAAMVTEDADIRDMAAGERFVGPAEVREFVEREWRDVASDARWELGQVLVDGEAFAAEWVTSGTKDRAGGGFPATGKPFEVHAVAVGLLREGKLAEARIYYDIAGLLVQWGLMPAPGRWLPLPVESTRAHRPPRLRDGTASEGRSASARPLVAGRADSYPPVEWLTRRR